MKKNLLSNHWASELEQEDLTSLRLVLKEILQLYKQGKYSRNISYFFVVPIADMIGDGITKKILEKVHYLLLHKEHILSFLGGTASDSFYHQYYPADRNDGSHIIIWHGDMSKLEILVASIEATGNPGKISKITNPQHLKVYGYKDEYLITNEGNLVVYKKNDTNTEVVLRLLLENTGNKVEADEVYDILGYTIEQLSEAVKEKEFYHLCRHLNDRMKNLNVPDFLRYTTKKASIKKNYLK